MFQHEHRTEKSKNVPLIYFFFLKSKKKKRRRWIATVVWSKRERPWWFLNIHVCMCHCWVPIVLIVQIAINIFAVKWKCKKQTLSCKNRKKDKKRDRELWSWCMMIYSERNHHGIPRGKEISYSRIRTVKSRLATLHMGLKQNSTFYSKRILINHQEQTDNVF